MATACGSEPPPRAHAAARPHASAKAPPPPRTAAWLYATRDLSGGSECDEVARWIEGEKGCRAALCVHARDLARDWTARCAPTAPAPRVERVRALARQYADAAETELTHCGEDAERIRRDGCGDDPTCRVTAERWAARCGKTDGSPLVLRMLERSVESRLSTPARVRLDPRDCGALEDDLARGARCTQRFACEDARDAVAVYRRRCEGGEQPPSLVAALHQQSIASGAGAAPAPLRIAPLETKLAPTDAPVVLVDGLGAVLSACDERPADLARYLETRRACSAGHVVLARALLASDGQLEVRVGTLDHPDDATFEARFPSLRAAGEDDARARAVAEAVGAELEAAAQLAAAPATLGAAVAATVRSVSAHERAIARAGTLRSALAAHDAALVPVLRELGRRKGAALRSGVPSAERAAVAARAESHAFADLDAEGAVRAGLGAIEVDVQEALPRGLAAYRDALRRALGGARAPAVAPAALSARAAEQARACAAAAKQAATAERALLTCAFGGEPCDDEARQRWGKASDDARAAARAAERQLALARTAAPEGLREAIARDAAAAGCAGDERRD